MINIYPAKTFENLDVSLKKKSISIKKSQDQAREESESEASFTPENVAQLIRLLFIAVKIAPTFSQELNNIDTDKPIKIEIPRKEGVPIKQEISLKELQIYFSF